MTETDLKVTQRWEIAKKDFKINMIDMLSKMQGEMEKHGR